jgi:hypothetical protein
LFRNIFAAFARATLLSAVALLFAGVAVSQTKLRSTLNSSEDRQHDRTYPSLPLRVLNTVSPLSLTNQRASVFSNSDRFKLSLLLGAAVVRSGVNLERRVKSRLIPYNPRMVFGSSLPNLPMV